MITPAPGAAAPAAGEADSPPPEEPLPPTPWKWRAGIGGAVLVIAAAAYLLHAVLRERPDVASRIQAGAGVLCFLGVAAFFPKSLQSVSRKTLLWGIGLQFSLAVAVIHSAEVRLAFD